MWDAEEGLPCGQPCCNVGCGVGQQSGLGMSSGDGKTKPQ